MLGSTSSGREDVTNLRITSIKFADALHELFKIPYISQKNANRETNSRYVD